MLMCRNTYAQSKEMPHCDASQTEYAPFATLFSVCFANNAAKFFFSSFALFASFSFCAKQNFHSCEHYADGDKSAVPVQKFLSTQIYFDIC